MPVFPDVGSTITVLGLMQPSRSRYSTMANPMRSFTEPRGLKSSNFARIHMHGACLDQQGYTHQWRITDCVEDAVTNSFRRVNCGGL